jgi:60 kDa SS-A/Ro ribonucleoprotein
MSEANLARGFHEPKRGVQIMSNSKNVLMGAIASKQTPQTQPIPGRESEMAKNNAGGFTFVVSPWDQLDRFLILGTEGGTYYVGERELTKSNAQNVLRLIDEDGIRVVNRVVEISDSGRAPKNDPALFVLALASAADSEATRKAALDALPKVARIGTHLFHFAAFVDGVRGWGRALRRAVGNWYLEMPLDRLANQAIKYQQRDGWSHRDMLRLGHPKTDDVARDAVLRWMVGGMSNVGATDYVRGSANLESEVRLSRSDVSGVLHPQILAFEAAKKATSAKEIIQLIVDHNLPREAIPTQFLNDANVWEALLTNMSLTAMIRNLGKMSSVGLLTPMSAAEKLVKAKLSDGEALRKARVHPIAILAAMKTYGQGRGFKGSLSWNVVRGVVDSLDQAFYASFGNVAPTGKNTLLALDVSGSMGSAAIGNIPGLTARDASAAMALITANVENSYEFIGFTGGSGRSGYGYGYGGRMNANVKDAGPVSILKISPRQRLDDVINTISGLPFGNTDCSLPFEWALDNKLPVENFAVYTDNETYAGRQAPSQALKTYRQKTGIPAKSVVVGMTATSCTIADPKDAGMLDVVGFSQDAPQVMSDFFSK